MRGKMFVQMPHRARHVAFLHHEADVDFGSALGNHADVYVRLGDGVENAGRDAGLSVNVFAHQADDGLLVFAGDVGDFSISVSKLSGRRLVSMVNDMLTSEMATMSTEVACRSRASNTERRNPCTIMPRDATTFTMLMPVFAVMARKIRAARGAGGDLGAGAAKDCGN